MAKTDAIFFSYPHNKLKKNAEGFYTQSVLSDQDFISGMDLYLRAKKLDPDSKEQIKLYYQAASQHHFYFAIKHLLEKFNEFAEMEKASAVFTKLRHLLFYCSDINSISNEDLADRAINFIRDLSSHMFLNGTPGFVAMACGYGYLTSVIATLARINVLNNEKASMLISDFFKNSIELLFAAKLIRSDSEAEMRNAFKKESAIYDLYTNENKFIHTIYQSYHNYYQRFALKNALPIEVLKTNAIPHTSKFLAFIKPCPSENANIRNDHNYSDSTHKLGK